MLIVYMSEIPEIVRSFKWDEDLEVKDKQIILGKLLAYQDIEEYCKTIRESYTRLLKINNTETEEQCSKDTKPEATFFKNPEYKNVST